MKLLPYTVTNVCLFPFDLSICIDRGLTQPLDLDKERVARTPEEMAAEAAELRRLFW